MDRDLRTKSEGSNYTINVIIMSAGFFGIFLAFNTTQVGSRCCDQNLILVSFARYFAILATNLWYLFVQMCLLAMSHSMCLLRARFAALCFVLCGSFRFARCSPSRRHS